MGGDLEALQWYAESRGRNAWLKERELEDQLEPFQRDLLSDVYVAFSALARSLEKPA